MCIPIGTAVFLGGDYDELWLTTRPVSSGVDKALADIVDPQTNRILKSVGSFGLGCRSCDWEAVF
jgi:hypothetical protein